MDVHEGEESAACGASGSPLDASVPVEDRYSTAYAFVRPGVVGLMRFTLRNRCRTFHRTVLRDLLGGLVRHVSRALTALMYPLV